VESIDAGGQRESTRALPRMLKQIVAKTDGNPLCSAEETHKTVLEAGI